MFDDCYANAKPGGVIVLANFEIIALLYIVLCHTVYIFASIVRKSCKMI